MCGATASIFVKTYNAIIASFDYLKASPLPPAPLAVAGFLVASLVAWQSSYRLAGLLGLAVCSFVLPVLSAGVFVGSLLSVCQLRFHVTCFGIRSCLATALDNCALL